MTTTEADISELTHAVEIVYKIECTYCGDDAEEPLAAGSASGAAERFYRHGWRTTESDTLCPSCAEAEV